MRFPKPEKRQPRARKRIARRSAPRPRRKGAAAEKRRAEHSRWADRVMEKNGGWCIACQTPGADDPAHIFPKGRYPHIRHLPSNGLPLCRSCHDYYTRRPKDWLLDVEAVFIGREAFRRLRRRALELP